MHLYVCVAFLFICDYILIFLKEYFFKKNYIPSFWWNSLFNVIKESKSEESAKNRSSNKGWENRQNSETHKQGEEEEEETMDFVMRLDGMPHTNL